MNKKEIRKLMLEKRNSLSPVEQETYSKQIAENVLNSKMYQNSKNICVYQAFRNEVSCDKITECALKDGKQVFVPVSDMDSSTMEFYQITESTKWVEGAYGIMEPVLEDLAHKLTEKALVLMPGLVFDKKKHRIGYGGGYYDRYLSAHTEHITAALCYHFQVIEEELPCDEYDILPNYIITDKEIL